MITYEVIHMIRTQDIISVGEQISVAHEHQLRLNPASIEMVLFFPLQLVKDFTIVQT